MSNDVTYTTTGRFPVVDITHHSKRTQEGNLKNRPDRVFEYEDKKENTEVQVSAPRAVTLENAIDFYTNAQTNDIQLAKLYSATVVWLSEYLKLKSVKEGSVAKEKTEDEIAKQIEEELNEMPKSEKDEAE